jgi:ribosomal protein L16/L10AE
MKKKKSPNQGKDKKNRGRKEKENKKKSGKKKKVAPLKSIDKPAHRLLPIGINLSWRSSRNFIIKTTGYGELTASVLKAFRKALLNKRIRRLFLYYANPYFALTKKTFGQRMGKGNGTKVQQKMFPFIPGQILQEINVTKRGRLRKWAIFSIKSAAQKLPFRIRITNKDI